MVDKDIVQEEEKELEKTGETQKNAEGQILVMPEEIYKMLLLCPVQMLKM